MCGIIGYVGKKPAKDILIDGLAKLEYRGYDSAGIALLNDDDTLTIKKKAGRVEDLREMCSDDSPVYRSTCGIGHTRWATHGGVTDVNAHPHRCGDVALIHNGIIENYNDIVREYRQVGIRDGHRGSSSTSGHTVRWQSHRDYQKGC